MRISSRVSLKLRQAVISRCWAIGRVTASMTNSGATPRKDWLVETWPALGDRIFFVVRPRGRRDGAEPGRVDPRRHADREQAKEAGDGEDGDKGGADPGHAWDLAGFLPANRVTAWSRRITVINAALAKTAQLTRQTGRPTTPRGVRLDCRGLDRHARQFTCGLPTTETSLT